MMPLLAQLREWDVDLVYTNSAVVPIGILAARLLGLPHVWHLREFGDLDYDLKHDWGWAVFRRVVRSSDAVMAVSKAVRDHLLGAGSKVHVIYNGVAHRADFERRYRHITESSPARPYTFLAMGLFHPQKGQDLAIRAFARVCAHEPDTRLLLAGSGAEAYLNVCKDLARQLGVADRVEFAGYVKEPSDIYRAVDALLMCSRSEAMGRVTAEAMSFCLPVIGVDSGGTPEIVINERTGLLCAAEEAVMADCMLRLMRSPKWARELGVAGWQRARERFTTEVYSEKVFRVLSDVART